MPPAIGLSEIFFERLQAEASEKRQNFQRNDDPRKPDAIGQVPRNHREEVWKLLQSGISERDRGGDRDSDNGAAPRSPRQI